MPAQPDVRLERLVFTLSWEDPALDRAALKIGPGQRVATVASGGCNALTFLLDDPGEVLAFDYNPTQVWVVELKAAAFRTLDYPALLELFGVRPSTRRQQLLREIEPALSPQARAYWRDCPWLLRHGLLGGGRYERFVRAFGFFLRLIQGRRRIAGLFQPRDREARRRFYAGEWDTWPWRLLFKIFFNKRMLARRGLSADYFTFAAGGSFARAFAERTARALTELPTHDNPFLARYVLGRYRGEESLPEYLRPEAFPIIQRRIGLLRARVGDVRTFFDDTGPAAFDAICLSNVFELMSEGETGEVLGRVSTALRPGGRLTIRNLIVPRKPPATLEPVLRARPDLATTLHQQDRSFVYSSFQVYERTTQPAATGGDS